MPAGTVVVVDRYEFARELGVGGMGAVFEAFNTKLERSVAIKFLDPSLVTNEEHVTRFQREALAAGRIGHPNICDVRDRGVPRDGFHFIVMEFLEGVTFYDLIRKEGPLPPPSESFPWCSASCRPSPRRTGQGSCTVISSRRTTS